MRPAGTELGARLAAVAASRHPDLFSRLVLLPIRESTPISARSLAEAGAADGPAFPAWVSGRFRSRFGTSLHHGSAVAGVYPQGLPGPARPDAAVFCAASESLAEEGRRRGRGDFLSHPDAPGGERPDRRQRGGLEPGSTGCRSSEKNWPYPGGAHTLEFEPSREEFLSRLLGWLNSLESGMMSGPANVHDSRGPAVRGGGSQSSARKRPADRGDPDGAPAGQPVDLPGPAAVLDAADPQGVDQVSATRIALQSCLMRWRPSSSPASRRNEAHEAAKRRLQHCRSRSGRPAGPSKPSHETDELRTSCPAAAGDRGGRTRRSLICC